MPLTANCIPKDDTLLLQTDVNENDALHSLQNEDLCLSNENNNINNETIQTFFEHDYASLSDVTFNNYLDIISHISGYVVKKRLIRRLIATFVRRI